MAVLDAVRRTIYLASAVSPRLGGAVALSAFFTTRPRLRVHASAASTIAEAARADLDIRGRRVAVYAWGEAGPVVALAHGWRGRASQFAPLVRALRTAGFRVVAFDVAAHGESEPGRVDVRDWIAVLQALDRMHGGLHAVVGHSFGGFAALTALRRGLRAEAVVTIAGAGAPDAYLREFGRMMRLDPESQAELVRRFLCRIDETPTTVGPRYDAIAHPVDPRIPLLIVHGAADRQVDPEEALLLHHAHPGSRLALLDGVGHNRILAEPDLVDDIVAFVRDARREPARAALLRSRRDGSPLDGEGVDMNDSKNIQDHSLDESTSVQPQHFDDEGYVVGHVHHELTVEHETPPPTAPLGQFQEELDPRTAAGDVRG